MSNLLYTGVMSDALHFDMGLQYSEFLLGDSKNFPCLNNYGIPIFGRVYPVEGMEAEQLDLEKVNDMLKDFRYASIYFMKSGTDKVATFGDITSRFLANKCCLGAIITGRTRDSGMLDCSFPTFAGGYTCVDAYDMWNIKSYGEPVEYNGIEITQDDSIFADEDAVLFVKEEWIEDAFRHASSRLLKENHIRKQIFDGKKAHEIYKELGRW